MCLKLPNIGKEAPIWAMVMKPNLYFAQNVTPSRIKSSMRWFQTSTTIQYDSICDDFGPMNMSSVISFIKLLQEEIDGHPDCKIVYWVPEGARSLTNAIFLLGAYLIIKHGMASQQVWNQFKVHCEQSVVPFRDATYSEPDFGLTLMDCWKGLERGKEQGWIQLPSHNPALWGEIEPEEYEQYDNPLDGDLHEVVPGKFVAFKGPKDIGNKSHVDDFQGFRHFSPQFYLPIFQIMNVKAVIRLNESEYDGNVFSSNGVQHHDLEFDDCTSPPVQVVRSFFEIVDRTDGAVAVHCRAGLGRTGTLIALYLMRSHGFTAREAIGWLRIMRPGSVIGEQQHYLCAVEKFMRRPPPSLQMQRSSLSKSDPTIGSSSPANSATAGSAKAEVGINAFARIAGTITSATAGAPPNRPSAAVLAQQVANGIERRACVRASSSSAAIEVHSKAGDAGVEPPRGLPALKPTPPMSPLPPQPPSSDRASGSAAVRRRVGSFDRSPTM